MRTVRTYRYQLLTVPGITPNGLVNNIDFKVPADFKMLTGVGFSASRNGSSERSYILGHVSLHINGKRSNPLQSEVQVKPFQDNRRKFGLKKLREPLLPGTRIQGIYRDFGSLVLPYDLKIYLFGIHENIIW